MKNENEILAKENLSVREHNERLSHKLTFLEDHHILIPKSKDGKLQPSLHEQHESSG